MEWQKSIQSQFNKLFLQLGQCDLCGETTDSLPLLCSHCLAELPIFTQEVVHGDLLNWPAINHALPNITFDHLFCLAPYLPPLSQWLTEFKYQGRFELANIFADLLAHEWQKKQANITKVDMVLAVPLHSQKWQSRGYNQAHLIAKRFAKTLALPYQGTALKRVKKNTAQVGQTGAQRRKNLANAFALRQNFEVPPEHVILIDDVITTGSTASAISKMLKHSGAAKVTVVTVCLSLPKC